MRWKVILSDIDLGKQEQKAVGSVIKSRWLSQGEVTRKFESTFAGFVNVKYALAVSSATAGLHLTLKAVGIKENDEVLVPSLTFVATVNSILYLKAVPVFVDITSLQNLNLSPEDLERKISLQTKAIVVVHYAGYPAEMEKILKIAHKYNLRVIEDAAHSPGASLKEKSLGSWGDVGVFSFFANKNLVTGEGGMVVTNDSELYEKIRLLRSHGMTSLSWDKYKGHSHSYDVQDLGYNYRLTEIASALGLEQLKKLKRNNHKRKALVNLYIKLLKGVSQISIPFRNFRGKPAYHIFPIILNEETEREEFIDFLKKKKIQTSIHYIPVHTFSYYRKNFPPGVCRDLKNTEIAGRREVTLPLHPLMTEKAVKYVAGAVKDFFKR